jgi:hypothetical protein
MDYASLIFIPLAGYLAHRVLSKIDEKFLELEKTVRLMRDFAKKDIKDVEDYVKLMNQDLDKKLDHFYQKLFTLKGDFKSEYVPLEVKKNMETLGRRYKIIESKIKILDEEKRDLTESMKQAKRVIEHITKEGVKWKKPTT